MRLIDGPLVRHVPEVKYLYYDLDRQAGNRCCLGNHNNHLYHIDKVRSTSNLECSYSSISFISYTPYTHTYIELYIQHVSENHTSKNAKRHTKSSAGWLTLALGFEGSGRCPHCLLHSPCLSPLALCSSVGRVGSDTKATCGADALCSVGVLCCSNNE